MYDLVCLSVYWLVFYVQQPHPNHDLFETSKDHVIKFRLEFYNLVSFFVTQRLTEEECAKDIIVTKLYESTEEGQKVTRNNGDKFLAVYRRIADPAAASTKSSDFS